MPTCPKWTLKDLVAHVGRGLRYAAAVTARRTFVPFDLVPEAALPDAPAPWVRSAAALGVAYDPRARPRRRRRHGVLRADPRPLRGNQSPALRNRTGHGETLHLHATDGTGDWRLTRTRTASPSPTPPAPPTSPSTPRRPT